MMAASGHGASPASYPNASILDVLLAYGSRGGALFAAYRHLDNPLLLTHVRWQGQNGEMIEATRSPDDMSMLREEREAWARIALISTTLRPDSVGPNAPWLQAPLDPREAHAMASDVQRARAASAPHTPFGSHHTPQHSFDIPSNGPIHQPAFMPPGFDVGSAPGYLPPSHSAITEYLPTVEPYNSQFGSPLSAVPEAPQATGSWQRDAFHAPAPQPYHHTPNAPLSQPGPEIVVVVCIEIEMPSLVTNGPQDFTRDFARDVALNFNRAARTIPQTRETRGWMHGAHMTLGALMTLGPGGRLATHGEMDHAANMLATALAYRTLPYIRMRFAEPAEWEQGVPLPN
ncbi:MAG TPA: hypothetical protein VF808_11105 [Ktedonobacterales bacterium]